jgi:hypothetical protein
MGSTLLIYDGLHFTSITANDRPAIDRMTIVLTHGWIKTNSPDPSIIEKPFDRWPTNMATLIRAAGITPAIANILAWDWRCAAQDPGWVFGRLPSFAADQTHEQGVALGKALQDPSALGPSYQQNLHFVGHSLGTLVNAAAVDYLHGYGAGYEPPSPTPWTDSGTHMTLLDHAHIVEGAGILTLMAAAGLNGSQPPLPHDFTWADNYQSCIATPLSEAVNVVLQKAPVLSPETDYGHGYAIDWYNMSITNPVNVSNPLGFAQSFEWDATAHGTECYFPPLGIGQSCAYHQCPWSQDDLALEPMSEVQSALGLGWDNLHQSAIDGVIQVQNATVQMVDEARSVSQTIGQGFSMLANQAMQGAQNVVHLWSDTSVLRLSLTTGLLHPPQQVHCIDSMQVLDLSSPTPTAAMAWLPVRIPTNDVAMVFDFILSGDPVDDVMVCGIADTNLLSLAARYIPTNAISTSRLLDVSQWSGQQIDLFFGLMGETSSNATLDVENIRFYSLQAPQLGIATTGSVTSLTWPFSAGGAVIETTTTLLTPKWETVSDAPTLKLDHYIMTGSWPDAVRFFRLRRSF